MSITFPATLISGDRLEFTSSDTTRSPADYELGWALRGPSSLDVNAVVDGDGWKTTILGAASANLSPGAYQVWGFLTDEDGERTTIYQGALTVKPNPAEVSDPYDPRSEAKKTLDAINATIRIRAEGGVSSYSIEGRSASYYGMEELLKIRDRYVQIVRQEETQAAIAQGLGNPNRLRVRFM